MIEPTRPATPPTTPPTAPPSRPAPEPVAEGLGDALGEAEEPAGPDAPRLAEAGGTAGLSVAAAPRPAGRAPGPAPSTPSPSAPGRPSAARSASRLAITRSSDTTSGFHRRPVPRARGGEPADCRRTACGPAPPARSGYGVSRRRYITCRPT